MRFIQRKQTGVALLIVLLVVAFVSIIAIEMTGRLQFQIMRTSNIIENKQAYWYAIGAESFARKIVAQLAQQDDPIHINQLWGNQTHQFPMPNGGIEVNLVDLQACFNLNALEKVANNDKTQEKLAFERLLQTQEFEIDSLTQETVRDALVDWLDSDSRIEPPFGAEDIDYEALEKPYLAANQLMSSKSEFRLIKGVHPKWINTIFPYLCVIPNKTELRINVNTIHSKQVALLAALLGSSISDAETILLNVPYNNINSFFQQPEVSNLNLQPEQKEWFVTETEYFILHVKSRYNDAFFSMSSSLQVVANQKVSTIGREFGGRF